MQELISEIKNLIIDTLNLEDITPEEINNDDPLFGDGLGLDSIDALEIGVAIKKQYGFELKGEDSQNHFESVTTLSNFVKQKQAA